MKSNACSPVFSIFALGTGREEGKPTSPERFGRADILSVFLVLPLLFYPLLCFNDLFASRIRVIRLDRMFVTQYSLNVNSFFVDVDRFFAR